VLARKPFAGSVAENVTRHGTGALNIDACRINVTDEDYARNCSGDRGHDGTRDEGAVTSIRAGGGALCELGRWPANVVHDGSPDVVKVFPNAPGAEGFVHGDEPSQSTLNAFGDFERRGRSVPRTDSGSAARFFYVAKASREDRDAGLASLTRAARNSHPTVKPTELMRYLCRLITPPGGTVIDPFVGSGSTGRGAFLEQFDFVGIDLAAENIELAADRIRAIAPLFADIEINREAASSRP
jgi:site-specific DNA-methyltransferase (adenine-specific)